MSLFITAVHMEPTYGSGHEHIALVRWVDTAADATDTSTRQQMVDFLNRGGQAWVADAQGSVQVGVVNANPPYLRTFADGRYTDNLLSLPRF
ncbi:DUF3892 domain-containing protein [Nocardioides sp. W3-2-3]|uniref:DUF3892 domain-containing protein n=1 Tax=Nocardioides convexus TaxID=2712224 RepID=UPI002418884D|nr:DUF3892 domain-containing protein [Nocardioides convexus]NHA00633.1 DUF3892 domain-containing protein [Nocardioides convexus]